MTNQEAARAVVHRWAELWSGRGDLTIADDLVAAEFVSHAAPPGLSSGPEGVKQWVGLFRAAFPDLDSAALTEFTHLSIQQAGAYPTFVPVLAADEAATVIPAAVAKAR